MSELISGAAAAVAKQVSSSLASKFADRLTAAISNMGTTAVDRLLVAFRTGFAEYVEASYNKCSMFKTIINPSEPLELKNHYVHINLSCGSKKLTDDSLISKIDELGYVVICGLAGSGKSMFMRHLTLEVFEDNKRNLTPLFFGVETFK